MKRRSSKASSISAKASAGDPDYLASIVRDTKGKVVAGDGDLKAADGFIEVVQEIKGGASGQAMKIGEYVLRLKTVRIDSEFVLEGAAEAHRALDSR